MDDMEKKFAGFIGKSSDSQAARPEKVQFRVLSDEHPSLEAQASLQVIWDALPDVQRIDIWQDRTGTYLDTKHHTRLKLKLEGKEALLELGTDVYEIWEHNDSILYAIQHQIVSDLLTPIVEKYGIKAVSSIAWHLWEASDEKKAEDARIREWTRQMILSHAGTSYVHDIEGFLQDFPDIQREDVEFNNAEHRKRYPHWFKEKE